MISSQPGDPIWIREGVFIANEVCNTGLPVGTILKKPKRGIFLERKVINSRTYIKTYKRSCQSGRKRCGAAGVVHNGLHLR